MNKISVVINDIEYVACLGYGEHVLFSFGHHTERFRALCGEALWTGQAFIEARQEPPLLAEALAQLESLAQRRWSPPSEDDGPRSSSG